MAGFFFFNGLWKTPLAAQFCFLQDCTYRLVFKSKKENHYRTFLQGRSTLHPPQHPAHTRRAAPKSASCSRDGSRLPLRDEAPRRSQTRGHLSEAAAGHHGRGTAGHLGWASARHLPYSNRASSRPPRSPRGAQRRREDAGSSLLLHLSLP